MRRLDDIVFVYGCIRTTRWAVASFIEGGVSAKFSLNGGYGSANAGIAAFATIGHPRAPISRWGPVGRQEAVSNTGTLQSTVS